MKISDHFYISIYERDTIQVNIKDPNIADELDDFFSENCELDYSIKFDEHSVIFYINKTNILDVEKYLKLFCDK